MGKVGKIVHLLVVEDDANDTAFRPMWSRHNP
jgi:hypothetical protein